MSVLSEQRVPKIVARIRRYFPDVDRVVDATKSIEVEVISKDVDRAKQKREDCCAMAKACERLPGVDGAIIKTSTAFIIRGHTATKFMVPDCVTKEIISFDRHGDFHPGKYYLTPVPKSARADGSRNNSKTKGKNRPYKGSLGFATHRRPYVYTKGIRSTPKAYDGV